MKNPDTVRAAGVDRNTYEISNLRRGHHKIKQDAKILQFLKHECQNTGTGAVALRAVFAGLLEVHDVNVEVFADAIREADDGE